MQTVTVALLQLLPTGSKAGNLEKGLDFCRKAKNIGADIALFPEMWSNGYSLPSDPFRMNEAAIDGKDAFILAFQSLAKELDMAIGVTFLEKYAPLPRNTFCLFDRFGRRVLTYAKVHTCDFDAERHLTAGNDFEVAELDTRQGTVKIGAMICYDREFPESARILMLKGAELILVPNACPMEQNRLAQLRARAYENMLGIATANYAYGKPDCNGHSSAFDGIAYRENEAGSRDMLVIEAGEAEGIYPAIFSMDEMRRYRASEVHGNAYRHPEKYGQLIDEEIREPFKRNDYRK